MVWPLVHADGRTVPRPYEGDNARTGNQIIGIGIRVLPLGPRPLQNTCFCPAPCGHTMRGAYASDPSRIRAFLGQRRSSDGRSPMSDGRPTFELLRALYRDALRELRTAYGERTRPAALPVDAQTRAWMLTVEYHAHCSRRAWL